MEDRSGVLMYYIGKGDRSVYKSLAFIYFFFLFVDDISVINSVIKMAATVYEREMSTGGYLP